VKFSLQISHYYLNSFVIKSAATCFPVHEILFLCHCFLTMLWLIKICDSLYMEIWKSDFS